MKFFATLLKAFTVVCIFAAPVLAEAGSAMSVQEFREQLTDFEAKVDSLQQNPGSAGEVITQVPNQVQVETGTGQITVSYKDFKNDLAQFAAGNTAKKALLLPRLRSYVKTLQEETTAFDDGANKQSQATSKMAEILARKEFNRVRGPSVLEVWLDRFFSWIGRRLGVARTGTWNIIQVMVYGLAAAALGALLVWTVLRLARPAASEDGGREIIPFSPSAKGWRTWLSDARACGTKNDWRGAIHLAYWAGISYLEEHGAWKPNRARTPREYLRLLGTWTPQHPPLLALTRKFEVVWYGDRPASEPDFKEILGELERLGCR